MTDSGKQAVLQLKYARIIEKMATMADISLEEAMGLLYNSDTMLLI